MLHVAFDFDGTLVDSRQSALDLYNAIAAQRGYKLMAENDVAALQQMSIPERLREMQVPVRHLPGLVLDVARRYRGIIDQLAFFPGIREMLADLHARGIALHILSSNTVANIRSFLDLQGVTEIASVHSARTLFGKNRSLATFMRNNRLKPANLIYVGDEDRDVVACRANGIRVIAVTWGFEARNVLEAARPDFFAERPEELVPLIVGTLSP